MSAIIQTVLFASFMTLFTTQSWFRSWLSFVLSPMTQYLPDLPTGAYDVLNTGRTWICWLFGFNPLPYIFGLWLVALLLRVGVIMVKECMAMAKGGSS